MTVTCSIMLESSRKERWLKQVNLEGDLEACS